MRSRRSCSSYEEVGSNVDMIIRIRNGCSFVCPIINIVLSTYSLRASPSYDNGLLLVGPTKPVNPQKVDLLKYLWSYQLSAPDVTLREKWPFDRSLSLSMARNVFEHGCADLYLSGRICWALLWSYNDFWRDMTTDAVPTSGPRLLLPKLFM